MNSVSKLKSERKNNCIYSGKNKPTVETAGFKTASENMRAVHSRNFVEQQRVGCML